jgi:acyl-CoA thioesterase-1
MKKSVLSFLTVFGLIIGVYVLMGCDHAAGPAKTGNTLVCFGNSLTTGRGATVPGKDDRAKSFPAYLQTKIKIPVINAGTSGITTAWAVSQVEKNVIAKNPLMVIIELGANDLFFGTLGKTIKEGDIKNIIETTQENLQRIIDLIDNGGRKIYIVKFYTEDVARDMAATMQITDPAQQTELINHYNTIFDTLASSSENIELIEDIWSGVWGIYMSDNVHPNAKGYEIMADNIFKVLEPYLQENDLLKEEPLALLQN